MKISINSVLEYDEKLEGNSIYAKIAHMGNNANNEVCNLEVVQEQKNKELCFHSPFSIVSYLVGVSFPTSLLTHRVRG